MHARGPVPCSSDPLPSPPPKNEKNRCEKDEKHSSEDSSDDCRGIRGRRGLRIRTLMALTIVLVIFVDSSSGWIIDEEVGQGVRSAIAAVHDGDAQSVCRIGIEGSSGEQRLFEGAVCARE